jgi:osmoprotectant transport system substrate-binding protein
VRARLIIPLLAMALCAACVVDIGSGPEEDPPVPSVPDSQAIVIGAFDFSESRVLAEIYGTAMEAHGFPVDRNARVASREILEPALEQNFVDLVPEYQGTALAFVSLDSELSSQSAAQTHSSLAAAFDSKGIEVLDYAPAENKNEVVVTRQTAEQYGLTKISDLARVASQFVFGGPPECRTRPLCIPGFEERYGLEFEGFQSLDAGGPLTVAALEGGDIDVALLFSTSPALSVRDLVVLDDDLELQPSENIVPVIRQEIADMYGKELIDLLNSISARLTTSALQDLNEQVELDEADPVGVASEWLEVEGLIE